MVGNLLNAIHDHRDDNAEIYRFFGGASRTAGEFRKLVGQMACAFQELGVGRGDRVSFKLEKSEEVLILAHACLQLGAILHPLNTAYTDVELANLVADASPRLFICDMSEAERLRLILEDRAVHTLSANMAGTLGEAARAAQPLESVCDMAADEVAALLYTSGTTGQPKGACITHGNLVESAVALAGVWQLTPSDRLLHVLPMYHAHGLLTAINSMMVAGGSILFLPRFDAAEVIERLPQATVMMGVPTHYARLLKEDGFGSATAQLRLAISGSAPLSREIADRFLAVTGRPIIERYGSTETAIVTAVPAGTHDRAGFVGWALPGVEVRVRTSDGVYARAAIGSLETRGHNVFAGYWQQPGADADAFTADGWFVTGDIASIDETGCVSLIGRSKDLIITGGLNVYPKEVEEALDALLAGGESAVFGVPHADFGEAVVAAVEAAEVCEAKLIHALRERLAPYKVPKRILQVPEIPRNRVGKVLKNELRARWEDMFKNQS